MGAAVPFVAMAAAGAGASYLAAKSAPKPPTPIRSLPEGQSAASRFKPTNYMSIMNTLMGDQMEIIKDVNGRMNISISNPKGSNVKIAPDRNIPEQALAVIMLSESMTDLGNAIEEMERTSPYLIPQNQELINSYRTAVSSALDRGFDFKQQAIDTKLSKMGLTNSSTALGVQVALARERANAMAEAELKQAELAQGLKQQAIGNLMNRGKLLSEQGKIEVDRFKTESAIGAELRDQDFKKEIALTSLEQDRQKFLTAAGIDMFNNANNQALNAQNVDTNRINSLNSAQYGQYDRTRKPFSEALGTLGGSLMTAGTNFVGKTLFEDAFPNKNREKKII
jgi:hypothetical protein